MGLILHRSAERLNRVRLAVIEQAVGLGLNVLARAADQSNDETEILQAAVADIARRLYLDEDQARLAVFAGVMVGRMTAALRAVQSPSTGT